MLAVQPPDLAVATEPTPWVVANATDGEAALVSDRTLLLTVRNGKFELWATRRADGGVQVEQVIGQERRLLGMRRASFSRGLPALVRIVVRRPSGAVVRTTYADTCPNDPRAQPFDLDRAPRVQRYPFDCGHVFSSAVVWGIERGWAVPVDLRLPGLRAGRYVLEASIAPGRVLHRAGGGDRVRVPIRLRVQRVGRTVYTTSQAPGTDAERTVAATGLPDLVPLPPESFAIARTPTGRDVLRFGSNVWNAGTAPAVVIGRRGPSAVGRSMPAFQVLGGRQRPAGRLVYDTRDGHLHWHFDGLARYRLLRADGSEALASTKIGFCFGSTDAIDLARPAARWNPPFNSDGCAAGRPAARRVRMDVQVGWGDQYDQTLPGQTFDVTGLPNGTYGLEVVVDPGGRLVQASRDNDRIVRNVVLGGRPGARTVSAAAWEGVDSERAVRRPAARTFSCTLPLGR